MKAQNYRDIPPNSNIGIKKKKNLRFGYINFHTCSHGKVTQDLFIHKSFFDHGDSLQHGIINKLLMNQGFPILRRLETRDLAKFFCIVMNRDLTCMLDRLTKSFHNEDEEKRREWISLPEAS